MNPVAIFRFSRTEGPGHFATFLERHGVPFQLFKLDEGDVLPHDLSAFSGFVFMGGPMSVNDDLPWIPPILELIRKAVSANQPCLGHCLGGQLMSKALGGVVARNAVKEIGWHTVQAEDNDIARQWLEGLTEFTTFQWHGETFSLPPGATRILTGPTCANQAYVLGPHLGMQCHVEMTPTMVKDWCTDGAPEIAAATAAGQSETVMQPDDILRQMNDGLGTLNKVADRLYAKWLAGLPDDGSGERPPSPNPSP